jgi:hypothetical protein
MALTLIVEDGTSKPDSNTYIGLADADAYFEGRLNNTAWTGADIDTKTAALIQATRLLDSYVTWTGSKKTAEQSLQFPRAGIYVNNTDYSGIIPTELKNAECELALVLLQQDTQAISDTIGFSQISVAGTVSLTIDKHDRVKEVPSHVFMLISHLGNRKGRHVRLVRT